MSSQASVTLISGVTDCWRRDDLLTFYFGPLLSVCLYDVMPGSHYDERTSMLGWGCHVHQHSSYYPVKPTSPKQVTKLSLNTRH